MSDGWLRGNLGFIVARNTFGDRLGLLLWLQPTPGHKLLTFGHEAREALRGLGYVGN